MGTQTFTNLSGTWPDGNDSTQTWVCPQGVLSVQAECWGGGRGGYYYGGSIDASGGAGGSYSKVNAIPVASGTSYKVYVPYYGRMGYITVPTPPVGHIAQFQTCIAPGGGGGNPTGDTSYMGGAGGIGTGTAGHYGGGGGGGAGSDGTGYNGENAIENQPPAAGGLGRTVGGGNGGKGGKDKGSGDDGEAAAGSNSGGGGGGGSGYGTFQGGLGGAGKVILTWTDASNVVQNVITIRK